MSFQDIPDIILWRLHLKSSPARVYRALSTNAGRATFWAESAEEQDEKIRFIFPGGIEWEGRVLQANPPSQYVVQYYGNTTAAFTLQDDGQGGTDLTLTDTGVSAQDRTEVII